MSSRRCWAVVPAAGSGSRMGSDTPKQYVSIAGKTLLEHSVLALLEVTAIEAVVVALPADDTTVATLPALSDTRVRTTTGGAQRCDSVLAGLRELMIAGADDEDWVLVHDAARPCLRAAAVERLIEQVTGSGLGGILALPVVDTVKRADEQGRILETVDRSTLWRAQTPQMFPLGDLKQALEGAIEAGSGITDEAAAMEMAGHSIQLVRGEAGNLKVTEPADLALAAFYLDNPGP